MSNTVTESMPDDQKNSEYWHKRRKNNEAARRSREKRKMNDELLERRVRLLTEENKQLKSQLLAIKMKYGELNDICTPLSSSIALTREFYDTSNFDSDSTDSPSELKSLISHSKDVVESSAVSRLFTSKVFTNASGDTSATVHVNKLPGSSQIQSNKFVFPEFSTIHEDALTRQRMDFARDYSKPRIGNLPKFDFRRQHRSEISVEKQNISRLSDNNAASESDDAENVNEYLLQSKLIRNTKRKEEEAALLLAGKFSPDIPRTLNMVHQVPLSSFTQLTRKPMEYPSFVQGRNNGSTASSFSVPVGAFFKSLREKTHGNIERTSPQERTPSPPENNINHNSNCHSKAPKSPNVNVERAPTPEAVAQDLTFKGKRKAPNESSEPQSTKVVCQSENAEEEAKLATQLHLDEAPKKYPVQLPYKLRLKKAGNFDKT